MAGITYGSFLTIPLTVYLLCALYTGNIECNDTRIPLKLAFLGSTSSEAKFFGGAFFLALEDVNNNSSMLESYRLEYLFNDTKEDTLNAINAMISQYGNNAVAFIGPDVTCHSEATVAAAWNLPMIGYKCHDWKKEESMIRKTFARTQTSTSKVSKSIISIFKFYKWKRFTMVVGSSAIWNKTADSLMELSKLNDIYVNKVAYFKEPYAFNTEMFNIADSTHTQTRIYVFLGDYHGLIDFVRLLQSILGDKMSNYVVIAMDERLYKNDSAEYIAKKPFEDANTLDYLELQSFENVLLLVPRPPLNKKWEDFLSNVRLRNEQPPINGLPNRFGNKPIHVPIYAAYLYDAVYTYARALDKVVKNGGSFTNGTTIVDQIRNNTYTSILGYEVFVDKNGDAEGNYSLLAFNVNLEQRRVDVVPSANFYMTQFGVGIPEINIAHEIQWKDGKPPTDAPACGFDGEKCIKKFEWRILAVCLVVATVSVIAGGFFLRHYLYEQKLARLLWKIDFKDIMLVDSVEEIIPPARKKRRRSNKGHQWKFMMSLENESERATLLGDTKRERSTSSENMKRNLIGSYKGTIVSVKHIIKKNVEIDRDLKKQLQLRKELNHDNIARFIGACVETPHVYILTQFCSRGSLQDILQNEDFALDEMFISSLVSDLIKAMIFIHDSEICTHGNLKSSNCLVDARWVLTVSDFGLHKLVNERSSSVTDLKRYYDKLLWKAPELLRISNRDPGGTQKGDVYSFAFILYELIGRKGPWGSMECSSRDIIETVKQGNSNFRPNISDIGCSESFMKDCIEDCWHEDPEHRPDFKFIRFRLKPMLQGIKSNIFDNMIGMMEKYANNLEGLVAERTELLSEEKKMTENLLLRMLPRFVADRLKRGEPVVPAYYDSVSIYFSDIVGFTALSAESTPLEIVCMLNDLYTCFDATVENYDVYKIETIGDAYFVVSGLPVRNGDLHAGEIASMSLHMLREIKTFKMRHRPNDTMKLRIGIHSGPCVAGVVGLKMPRYTLFGDTVNTASRMETTGVPLKIHCSSAITALLTKLGGYHMVERGYVQAKGKGEILTYFLEGEDASHRQRRISHSMFGRANSLHCHADRSVPIFGASTIHPKYWPNGNSNVPSESYITTAAFQICDENNKAICDNKTSATLCPTSNQGNGSIADNQRQCMSKNNAPFMGDQITNTNTTSSSNPLLYKSGSSELSSELARAFSLNTPLNLRPDGINSVDNNNTHQGSSVTPGGRFENVSLLRKPVTTRRQLSLPSDIQEDTTL